MATKKTKTTTNETKPAPMPIAPGNKVSQISKISDPKAFILAGLKDVLDGQATAGLGVQRAAAGVLSYASATGWQYHVDGTLRSLTIATLKTYRKAKAEKTDDDAGEAAYKALREEIIGADPSKPSKDGGQVTVSADVSGRWTAQAQAFRKAYMLACKLADDGYSVANYTAAGFRVMASDIAPVLVVDKRRHISEPINGNGEAAIILNPAKSTTFVVTVDGAVKAMKTVRHSVESYMASGEMGAERATGKTIKKAADWLVKHLKAEDVTTAETLNALNALALKVASVLEAVNAREIAKAKKQTTDRNEKVA